MSKIGSLSLVSNAMDANGWVNVEMPEEEVNRIGSKGAERLGRLASQPQAGMGNDSAAGCASLVERLYATALRKTDGTASSESLRKALGVSVSGKIKKEYADLDFCRRAACNALNDLDSLTGREIASVEDGKVQPNAKAENVRALLDDAVNAQMKYAMELAKLASKLPKKNAARRTALLQLKERTVRRAMAIVDLSRQLKSAASKVDNDYDRQLLNRRGHTDGIYLKEARQSESLKTLQRGGQVDVLGPRALATAYAKLHSVYKKGGGQVRRRKVLCAAAHNIIDGIKPPSSIINAFKACERIQKDKQKAPKLMSIFPGSHGNENEPPVDFGIRLSEAFSAWKASLSRYVDLKLGVDRLDVQAVDAAAWDLESKAGELKVQLKNVRRLASMVDARLQNVHKLAGLELDVDVFDALLKVRKFTDAQSDWDSCADDVKGLCAIRDGLDETIELSEDDCLALLEGTRRLSTAVEAQVWNEKGHHDKELNGAVLIGCKPLGKGTFNAVKLCTFAKPDGTTVQRVFRPDSGARRSIKKGAIALFLSEPGDFSGFSYSRASERVASIFECEDVFPRTTFGALNGEPGMFLEVAPGKEGSFFRGTRPANVQKDPLGAKKGVETAGKIARKLNRLQWLDCLTGQVDRHMNNLMIGIGADKDVSVKGIDNDECFPDVYLGNGLLVFDNALDAVASGALPPGHCDPQEVNGLLADLSSFPTLRSYVKHKGKIVLDMAKLPLSARIKQMEYFKNFGLPDHIDKVLYRKLKSVKPETYAKSLRGQNLTENQIAAAVARFCLVRDSIDQKKVKVYDANDWTDVDKLKTVNEKNTILSAEIDGRLSKAEKTYRKRIDKLQRRFLRLERWPVKNQEKLGKVKARIARAGERFAEVKATLLEHKRTISNITSNYYARIGCHRYLGMEE